MPAHAQGLAARALLRETAYPYDVISEHPGGPGAFHDASLRPNAVIALAVDPGIAHHRAGPRILESRPGPRHPRGPALPAPGSSAYAGRPGGGAEAIPPPTRAPSGPSSSASSSAPPGAAPPRPTSARSSSASSPPVAANEAALGQLPQAGRRRRPPRPRRLRRPGPQRGRAATRRGLGKLAEAHFVAFRRASSRGALDVQVALSGAAASGYRRVSVGSSGSAQRGGSCPNLLRPFALTVACGAAFLAALSVACSAPLRCANRAHPRRRPHVRARRHGRDLRRVRRLQDPSRTPSSASSASRALRAAHVPHHGLGGRPARRKCVHCHAPPKPGERDEDYRR